MDKKQNLQSLVETFNQHSKSSLLLTKKCSELKEDKHYSVHFLKKMETSVGDAVVAALSDSPFKEGDRPKFQVFLPRRFVNLLQNEDLDAIQPGSLYIVSHGQTGNNTTELSLHIS
jgi:hypothetical protein